MCKIYAQDNLENTLECKLSKERIHNAYGNNDKNKKCISHLLQ